MDAMYDKATMAISFCSSIDADGDIVSEVPVVFEDVEEEDV